MPLTVLVLALAVAVLAAFPFLLYRPSLSLMGRMGLRSPARPVEPIAAPVRRVAVCVCAYNEEKVIAEKARNLLALADHAGVAVDLYVYVDAASDRTAEELEPFADRITIVRSRERHGKSHGMNQLVAQAGDADILVFSDANVMVAPDAISRLLPYFRDPEVGLVCGHLTYTNDAASATAHVGGAYWRLEEDIKRLESDGGCCVGADGSLFAMRRVLHRPVPPDIIDDFFLSLSVMADGHRVVRAEDVRAFEASATDSADEFRRKVRIACQSMNVHRLMVPRLRRMPWVLRFRYVGHKLLRWLSLPLLAVAGVLVAVAAGLAWGVPAALAVAGLGVGATVAVLSVPALARLREILLALAATSVGVARSLRGDRFQTWTPPDCRVSHEKANI